MNFDQINEFRVSHGLPALAKPAQDMAQKRRQYANKAARAQANRDMKSKRNGKGK